MTDDLIARLRSVDVSWSETGEWCAEAADRIEELEAWKAAEEAHHHMLRQELDRCRASNAVMDNTVASLTTEVERLRVIEADRAELVADVFAYLIAKAQEPVEIFTGSFAKPLHADERTAWLEKMRGEYNP